MKFKPINGWTKQKILEVLNAREFDTPSMCDYDCVYRSEGGNRCAAGLFIPDSLYSAGMEGNLINALMDANPSLAKAMPLGALGMREFQFSHDTNEFGNSRDEGDTTCKRDMIRWIEENVED